MVSTFTPNIQLEEPARGDDVGTWDTPVNNNMTLADLVVGAITTISLNNSPVVLAAAQYQSKGITFNSTLTGSVAITFPTSFKKSYEILNVCTGSSAFVITLGTTVAGGQAIGCPPGEWIECVNDGTNIKFKNLGRIGGYWDYGGSSVPAWVSGCTIPPYLNCDGTTFSAATYPALAVILGSTTLPDSLGRFRATLNQGTARLTSTGAAASLNGNTIFAGGGSQLIGQTNLPNVTLSTSGISATATSSIVGGLGAAGSFTNSACYGATTTPGQNINTSVAVSGGVALSSAGGIAHSPPAYVGGITMIRAG